MRSVQACLKRHSFGLEFVGAGSRAYARKKKKKACKDRAFWIMAYSMASPGTLVSAMDKKYVDMYSIKR